MNAFGLGGIAVHALGWSLLHFVWQAALVAAAYAALRALLPRGNPRYVASMLALTALALLPIATFCYEWRQLTQPVLAGALLVSAGASGSDVVVANAGGGWLDGLRLALPWLVLVWGCGVAFIGLRVVRQWRRLRAVVRGAQALPVWQQRARVLARAVGLRHAVRVLASVRIATPTLVGWVRPVVVVPLAMLSRMPVEQVDLVLAHELAHLRRLDHLANLFQVVLETLLFYHPVVHWISRDARNERELCCDALALRASGGNRRDFVAALAGLEEFRVGHSELALAASGGVLVERAWFIAGTRSVRARARTSVAVTWLGALAVAIVVGLAWHQHVVRTQVAEVLAAGKVALQQQLAAISVPLAAPELGRVEADRMQSLALPQLTVAAAPIVPVHEYIRLPEVAAPVLSVSDLDDLSTLRSHAAVRAPVDIDAGGAATGVPHAVHIVQPVYPPRASLEGLHGKVVVQFALSGVGVPQDAEVVDSTAPGSLQAAALQALSKWRFVPPSVSGRRYRQVFMFRSEAARAVDAAAAACRQRTGTHICRQAFDDASRLRVLQPQR